MAEAKKSTPVTDNSTVNSEKDAGKEAVMAAYSNLVEAKEHFKHAAEAAGLDLKNEASDQFLKGKAKAGELSSQANSYVQEKPLTSLGIAFAAGFLISQLYSRK
ncbi:DUF883 family protein [Halopseudomonas salina]|uniref:DUF883 domain-containing protein n=1 Tax=Halopseudomonas salina TaxID=1323744 RepID=A0ABQ1PX47_9GAMM|nr:DUF883 C-terminal domain-containing protein [Halopseudomonas salina]GGD06119.1 hypothetical protein GCM10007418_26440 [Halopseudomonas salina]